MRRGLMRYHLLVQLFLNCFTHTSPMTDPEFTLLFSLNSWVPKFVWAVKQSGFTDILEELGAGGFRIIQLQLFPLCCKCCTLIMICIFKYRFVFQSYVMKYIYSFRCEIRVTLMLCSSSSSILSFYLIFPHPLISFTNYQDFSTVWLSTSCLRR